MQSESNQASSIRRRLLLLTAMGGIATAVGCNSGGQSKSGNAAYANSNAVDAPGRTTVSCDTGQVSSSKAFPTDDRAGSMLLVDMTGPKTVYLQQQATYQVKVTNLTATTLRHVTLVSTTPEGFQPTAGAGAANQSSGDGTMAYPVGDLGPNESKSFNITGTATKVGSVDTCYSARCDYDTTKLCTSLAVTNPALALTVQAPPDTDICKPVTYQYTVVNNGTGTAHHVVLEQALPDGLMTADSKASFMADLGDIPQGDQRVATARLKASRTGSFPVGRRPTRTRRRRRPGPG